jgi:ketosteroid isomerase-like protein
MSQGNVEAFKRAVEANNRRDYDALLAELHTDVEWHGVMGVMFGGEATVYRGHAGVLEYLRDVDEGFTVRDIQWSEFRDLGERIVVLGHVRGRGRESGIELDSQYGAVADFKEGKVIKYWDYFDHKEALEAAALSE